MKNMMVALVVLAMALTGCKPVTATPNNTGVLIIDAQEAYVMDSDEFWIRQYYPDLVLPSENVDPSQAQQIANIANTAALAKSGNYPTMLTFEASDEGASRLIDQVAAQVPNTAERYIKQYFDITQETQIRAALEAWQAKGITEIVVVGAETDVCVSQSVHGLTRMGFNVHLNQDALFSTERYRSAALARMQSAGANLVDQQQTEHILSGKRFIDESGENRPVSLERSQMASLFLGTDSSKPTKIASAQADVRMQAWTAVNELAYRDVFGTPTMQMGEAFWPINSQFTPVTNVSDVIATMQAQQKSQLVVSGLASVEALTELNSAITDAGMTLFVIEDAWYGETAKPLPLTQEVSWQRMTMKMSVYEIVKAIYNVDMSAEYVQTMEEVVYPSGELPPELIELFPYILQ